MNALDSHINTSIEPCLFLYRVLAIKKIPVPEKLDKVDRACKGIDNFVSSLLLRVKGCTVVVVPEDGGNLVAKQ